MFAIYFILDIWLAYSSTLMMEAVCSSEMSLHFYQTTRYHIQENSTSHSQHYENFKSDAVMKLIRKCELCAREHGIYGHVCNNSSSKFGKQLWEPPTLKQALANQRGPRQLQRPFGRAPLATAYKDADLPHGSQSQLRLHRYSLYRAWWPELRRHLSDAPCLRVTAPFRAHSTSRVTALSACLLVCIFFS
jgi:hypothetical protein